MSECRFSTSLLRLDFDSKYLTVWIDGAVEPLAKGNVLFVPLPWPLQMTTAIAELRALPFYTHTHEKKEEILIFSIKMIAVAMGWMVSKPFLIELSFEFHLSFVKFTFPITKMIANDIVVHARCCIIVTIDFYIWCTRK